MNNTLTNWINTVGQNVADKLFSDSYTPHGFCLTWEPNLIFFTIAGNMLVFFAYNLIAIRGWYILYRLFARKDTITVNNLGWMIFLYSLFILLCGYTHLLDAVTLFRPYYWLQASLVMLTGVVSILTAVITYASVIPVKRQKIDAKIALEP